MRTLLSIAAPVLIAGAAAWSQTAERAMDHAAHGSHAASGGSHGDGAAPILTEPGQGAFAALAEVVRVLEADPSTDWSAIDLDGLRAHLRDMDLLVTGAQVETAVLPGGLRMRASGGPEATDAVRRMVPAHAAELARDARWRVEAGADEEGATLTVTSDDPAVAARIKGLGFFGLMASQDHHRAHHLMIARGAGAHAHE